MRGHQIADHLEMLPRHVVDLVAQPVFVVGAEAFDVHRVFAHQPVDLLPDAGWIGVIVGLGVRRHEAADIDAVHVPRRIAGRHAHHHHVLVVRSQHIPDGGLLNGTGVHYRQAVVGIIFAVTKSVDAQRAGILAGGHAHPGRYRDGRDHAFQPAITAALHQRPDIVQSAGAGTESPEPHNPAQ